jgi:hypothetical protein
MGTPQVMTSGGVFGLVEYCLQQAFERHFPAATSERPEVIQEAHTPATDRT